MKKKCRHDIKIEIMVKLFKPMTSGSLNQEVRLSSIKLKKNLDELKERMLISELRNKDGTVLYHTTPKGRKLVKFYKDLSDHLEGKDALPHIFGVYR
ncbi:MAG: hypothetical protein V1818_00375 [Candidatus Aenigmatarchaeota archaeon]